MKEREYKISLISLVLATVAALPADARVNVNNSSRSYANAYNQVNAIRYQQEYLAETAAAAVNNLPVVVSDEQLASEIANNTSETTMSDLDACAMIWPNGTFRWEIPESGIRNTQLNQCVAVVSLINGNTKEVLATTTVAAGDTMKCNIDYFPESGMNKIIVEKTELPNDAAPTMEDVEAVMNAEQRQNAGFKIVAGAVLGGVAGGLLAKKEPGADKNLGLTNTQWRDAAIGVGAGAGVMAASSYSGKVAGDTITSTAVNAASGMIIGNMLAGTNGGGDSYLDIQKCNIEEDVEGYPKGEYDCVAGIIKEKGDFKCTHDTKKPSSGCTEEEGKQYTYLINESGNVKRCEGTEDDEKKLKNCEPYESLTDIQLTLKDDQGKETISFKSIFGSTKKDANDSDFDKLDIFYYDPADGDSVLKRYEQTGSTRTVDTAYYRLAYGNKIKGTKSAYVVFKKDIKKDIKGYQKSTLDTLKKDYEGEDFYRNNNGSIGSKISKTDNTTFEVSAKDAEKGGLIDISNQARVKGTLVGTATGGAMGGFAGYQGAKSEITDRWTTAVREYEDSLSNFACMSGTRYLGKYNDYIEVPELKKNEDENK